jgi:hypothetical protein
MCFIGFPCLAVSGLVFFFVLCRISCVLWCCVVLGWVGLGWVLRHVLLSFVLFALCSPYHCLVLVLKSYNQAKFEQPIAATNFPKVLVSETEKEVARDRQRQIEINRETQDKERWRMEKSRSA